MRKVIDWKNLKVLKESEEGFGIILDNAGFIDPTMEKNVGIMESYREPLSLQQNKDMIVYALLQTYDKENRNGRIYPKKVLQDNVEKYQKVIKERRALNELNHPESSVIDLERVSHEIIETWWEGQNLWGKLKILTSPGFKNHGYVGNYAPDIAANLLLNGVTIGISSRGIGSLKKEGSKNIVQNDYELICFDLVSQPSNFSSWVHPSRDFMDSLSEQVQTKKTINEDIIKSLDNFLL
jgi:Prohead core protein serine protease